MCACVCVLGMRVVVGGGQNSGQLFPTDGHIDVMLCITSKLRDGTFLKADVDGFHEESDTEC